MRFTIAHFQNHQSHRALVSLTLPLLLWRHCCLLLLTQPGHSPLPLTELALHARLSPRHPHQLEVTILTAQMLACLVSVLTADTHTSVNHAVHVDRDAKRTVSMAPRGEADLACAGTTRDRVALWMHTETNTIMKLDVSLNLLLKYVYMLLYAHTYIYHTT